jgi:putative transcriptional regulator
MKRPIPPNIKAIREKLGMTQAEFAAKVGFSKSTISHFESSQKKRKTIPPRSLKLIVDISYES